MSGLSLSLPLLLLLLTSSLLIILCDTVSGYRVSRQTRDITTFEDQEGSGLDDDDETVYSGSGSGYPDSETELRSTTDVGWMVTSLPSVSVYNSAQPFTFALSRAAKEREGEQSTAIPGTSAPTGFATALITTTRPATAPAASTGGPQELTTNAGTDDFFASVVPVTTGVTAITTKRSPPDARGTARPSATAAPQTTPATEETSTATSISSNSSKSLLVVPSTTQETESWDVIADTTVTNEVEAPAGGAPSGDFAFSDNSEGSNEVIAVVSQPTDKVAGKNSLPGAIDNTIDTDISSSAAQLPQKNILERKEVLIAVIVGGVVGALFAAFLVMLLIYRMKKKDEGSYTLEEPKQASIAYQKPDKQEEFYA
ncbi:syndecan-3 [Callorhinchus milii]|uniref:syndecan-3 n=1 Tax=Callorhinchus milii TaxID=7868 RepID=UPI001C3F703F|nr:syndecan-3 [Callorhinchus milii]